MQLDNNYYDMHNRRFALVSRKMPRSPRWLIKPLLGIIEPIQVRNLTLKNRVFPIKRNLKDHFSASLANWVQNGV